MSVLDIVEKKKRGGSKITKSWLKKQGFDQCRWGSPKARLSNGSIMYEKLIFVNDINEIAAEPFIVGSILYFPNEFTGYATFNHMGFDRFNQSLIPNRTVVQFNDLRWEYNGYHNDAGFTTKTVNDMEEVMDLLKIELSKHDYVLV